MSPISRRVAVSGSLAFVLSACATPNSRSVTRIGPPMWRVDRDASRVFLFGQIPIPKGVDWLTPKIDAAFQQSEEIWFENPDFDPKTAGAAIQKRIASGGPKLGEAISATDRKRLGDLLIKGGRPREALDSQLTWQAYNAVAELVDTASGMDPASIAERLLKPRAKAAGKAIRSEWASMDEIMAFSSQHTLAQQLQLISKTLDEIRDLQETQRRAIAWASGDVSWAEAQDSRFRSAYPELSLRLVSERNQRWASRIADMLAKNKSTFVCVGLGHLVGSESIQAYLARTGIKAFRV